MRKPRGQRSHAHGLTMYITCWDKIEGVYLMTETRRDAVQTPGPGDSVYAGLGFYGLGRSPSFLSCLHLGVVSKFHR